MDQASFGLRLRLQRERRQISLAAIAQSSKIKESLLIGLERGDVSQWPAGIFRRAFLREYAAAIGLPPEDTVNEFVQVFPEGDARQVAGGSASSPEMRLTFADSAPSWARPWILRAIAASAESLFFVIIALAAQLAFGQSPWLVGGVLGFAYYAAATLAIGQSPLLWLMSDLGNGVRSSAALAGQSASSRDILHIVSLPARIESAASSMNLDSEPVRAIR